MERTWKELEKGRLLFAGECDFVMGAVRMEDIPPTKFPEIAFAGRSNVGKSSLVNALTGRKTLARVSNTPGRTKQVNFFLLSEKLMLADLPGYGYAKAAKKEVAGWNNLISQYLQGRPQLRRVLLLVDSRHGVKENDVQAMKLLDESAVIYQIILTKADKISQNERERVVASIEGFHKKHTALHPKVILTSAEKKEGIEELRVELAGFI